MKLFARCLLAGMVWAAPAGLGAGIAYADHGGDRYRQDEGCGEQGGGCNNERHEDYGNGGRKYSPSFQDSPVYFAPTVCLPGSTCNFEGRKDEPQR